MWSCVFTSAWSNQHIVSHGQRVSAEHQFCLMNTNVTPHSHSLQTCWSFAELLFGYYGNKVAKMSTATNWMKLDSLAESRICHLKHLPPCCHLQLEACEYNWCGASLINSSTCVTVLFVWEMTSLFMSQQPSDVQKHLTRDLQKTQRFGTVYFCVLIRTCQW